MALKLGTLFFDFDANTSKLSRKQKEIEKTNGKLTKSFKRLGDAITVAFAFEIIRRAIMLADKMTLLSARIDGLTKNQKESNKLFNDLIDLSSRVGIGIDGIVSSFQRFSLVKGILGANNDQILQFTENIQKLGIISGATGNEIASTSIQIGQALTNNFESAAQEINSINEQMPAVARAVEKNLGLIPGTFKKALVDGEVSAKQFFNAIIAETNNIDEKFKILPVTITRAWTEFQNVMAVSIKDLNEVSGITESIAAGIQKAADILRSSFKPALIDVQAFLLALISGMSEIAINARADFKILALEAKNFFSIGLGKDETKRQISEINNRRDAQIDANRQVTSEMIDELVERRLAVMSQPVTPSTTGPSAGTTPLSDTGAKITGVTDLQKIQAAMGDETQVILNALIDRNKKILELTGIGEKERSDLLIQSGQFTARQLNELELQRQQTTLTALSSFNDTFLSALKSAGKEQTAIFKAVFLAQKAIQVAQIIASTLVGSAAALSIGSAGIPLSNLIKGIGFANAGLVAGLGISETFSGGGRQSGGRAFAGFAHPINEDGRPEIFQQGGRQFLLPGNTSGDVMPLDRAGGGGGMSVVINNIDVPGIDITANSVSRGEIMVMIKKSETRTVDKIDASLSQGRGSTFRALQQGVNLERNIS